MLLGDPVQRGGQEAEAYMHEGMCDKKECKKLSKMAETHFITYFGTRNYSILVGKLSN